jgi:predicted DNA-binding transcriptional regulator YafY
MDKFDRIYDLHHCFAGRRTPLSIEQIGARLECSKSTAYRLVGLLRDRLGAPIVKDAATEGLLYDRSTPGNVYELPGLWFSAAELQALLEEQLAPLRRRIDQLLSHRRLNLGDIDQRVRVLGAAARPAGQAFRSVASATLQRRRLRFRYHSRHKDEVREREVSPQRLAHYRDNWYLDAWDHREESLRMFSVDRIENVIIGKDEARDLPDAELDAVLASAYGIFTGEADKEAVLRFSAERARWVADEQWHPRQSGRHLADGRYELRIPYRDSRELIMDVLRHGPEVEIIAPESLRRDVVDQLRRMTQVYGGPWVID